jgi:secreted PhoX family phosphatase
MSDKLDTSHNVSPNEHFRDVLERSVANPARRGVIRGGLGLAALSSIPFMSACGGGSDDPPPAPSGPSLGFSATDKSVADTVVLPAGNTYTVLHATGDRLVSSIPAFANNGTETDDWSQRIGDHHDGIELFYIGANGRVTAEDTGRAVLACNHESSADAHFFHPSGQTSAGVRGKKFSQFGDWDLGDRPALEVLKEINHHGVSLVEVVRSGNGWRYVTDSIYNRRVTAQTPVRIAGPAAHLSDIRALMATRYAPDGATARGTLNNCGSGPTPWGTFLTCEENWAVYFSMPKGSTPVDAKTVASRARYGVASAPLAASATTGSGQGWHTPDPADDRFARWNASATGANAAADFRNEPNTFGYNLEIDPLSASTAVKRVSMGRFAHEAAVHSLPRAGQPLAFYMGCDSRNEYIYKFVTAANWDPADVGGGIAAGDKYLDEGKLYAARFNADGTGTWLELSFDAPAIRNYTAYAFANQADVLVNARHAADAVGATKMDRPEWGAVNPANGDVYMTLTNNSAANRTPTRVDAANPRAYTDPDGRRGSGNPNGHIIRFRETGALATATSFAWDIFLFGAESTAGAANLSQLTARNAFSSPDGLWFSRATGICWIQTDDGAMTDKSNCMLLAAIPGTVGDGGRITVNNSMTVSGAVVTGTQDTFMGAVLGEGRLRRFMVAPKGSEVTGMAESADGRTVFVNIQHPGENTPAVGNAPAYTFESQWPGNAGYGRPGRPRSATIVISRTDGGRIGV